MRRKTATFVRVLSATALLLLGFASAQTGQAQQPSTQAAPRERISITMVSVKPEMIAEFENLIKNETNPALAKGGAKWRDVWQTATFGNFFEYAIVAPVDNFAEYDSPGALEKGLGKEGFAAWRAKAGRLVNSVRAFVMEVRPDLSHFTKMTGPPKMAVVSYIHVAPGRNAEYESYIKNEMLPVVKQSQVAGYWFHQTILGGDPNEYVVVVLHDNYAELEKGPVARRVLGQEGAMKLAQKLAPGVVTSVERTVIRYVPGLSYRPAQTANK
jgi:hypothetical protein